MLISKHYKTLLATLVAFDNHLKEYISKSINVEIENKDELLETISNIISRTIGMFEINPLYSSDKINEFYQLSMMKSNDVLLLSKGEVSEIDEQYIPILNLFIEFMKEKTNNIKNITNLDKNNFNRIYEIWDKFVTLWEDTI